MLVQQTVMSRLDVATLLPLAAIAPNLVLVFAAPRFFNDPGFAPGLAAAFPGARRVAVIYSR